MFDIERNAITTFVRWRTIGKHLIKKGAVRLPENTSLSLGLRYTLGSLLARRCFACFAFGALFTRREFKAQLLTLGIPNQKSLELALGSSRYKVRHQAALSLREDQTNLFRIDFLLQNCATNSEIALLVTHCVFADVRIGTDQNPSPALRTHTNFFERSRINRLFSLFGLVAEVELKFVIIR